MGYLLKAKLFGEPKMTLEGLLERDCFCFCGYSISYVAGFEGDNKVDLLY